MVLFGPWFCKVGMAKNVFHKEKSGPPDSEKVPHKKEPPPHTHTHTHEWLLANAVSQLVPIIGLYTVQAYIKMLFRVTC